VGELDQKADRIKVMRNRHGDGGWVAPQAAAAVVVVVVVAVVVAVVVIVALVLAGAESDNRSSRSFSHLCLTFEESHDGT
jgi:hypothetical protein